MGRCRKESKSNEIKYYGEVLRENRAFLEIDAPREQMRKRRKMRWKLEAIQAKRQQ